MTTEFLQDAVVPPDHACLEGHFPDNPVVPGTLILQKVLQAIARQWPDTRVTEVVSAKFVSPLKPGETYTMRISQQPGGMQFECNRSGHLLATGRLLTSHG